MTDPARLALMALLVAPVTATAAWWAIIGLTRLQDDSWFLALAIGLAVAAMAATAAYGHRRRVDIFWTAAAVLSCLVATAAAAFISFAISCASGCG